MEQAQLEGFRQQFDSQVRRRFPEDEIERVEVLQYGDDPEVEPGQLLAQVVFRAPAGSQEREQAFKALHEKRHAAFGELRDHLDKFPVTVMLRFTIDNEYAEDEPKARPVIQLMKPSAGMPGGDAQTPVMARLGREDLETLDTLITAGIASSRAEAVRWALARIRERPAYEQLRARTREIEELKSQF
jgi:hypothetical protein